MVGLGDDLWKCDVSGKRSVLLINSAGFTPEKSGDSGYLRGYEGKSPMRHGVVSEYSV